MLHQEEHYQEHKSRTQDNIHQEHYYYQDYPVNLKRTFTKLNINVHREY